MGKAHAVMRSNGKKSSGMAAKKTALWGQEELGVFKAQVSRGWLSCGRDGERRRGDAARGRWKWKLLLTGCERDAAFREREAAEQNERETTKITAQQIAGKAPPKMRLGAEKCSKRR